MAGRASLRLVVLSARGPERDRPKDGAIKRLRTGRAAVAALVGATWSALFELYQGQGTADAVEVSLAALFGGGIVVGFSVFWNKTVKGRDDEPP